MSALIQPLCTAAFMFAGVIAVMVLVETVGEVR